MMGPSVATDLSTATGSATEVDAGAVSGGTSAVAVIEAGAATGAAGAAGEAGEAGVTVVTGADVASV
jgi:hypothetical protein